MKQYLALAVAMMAGAAQASLLVNGSFEQGTGGYAASPPVYDNLPGGSSAIAGWTTVGAGVEWFMPAHPAFNLGPARDGQSMVDLADYISTGTPPDGVVQTVATIAGQRYRLDFSGVTHLANDRDGTGTIEFWLNGSLLSSHALANAKPNWTMADWQDFSVHFIAAGPSTTIGFLSRQNANRHFAYLDAVSLVADPIVARGVPEPASWAMLVAGFGLVGGLARRRRLDAVAALG